MEEITGKITALSHIIYIHPKSVFMEISIKEDEKKNVMISIRSQLEKWSQYLIMRNWIKVTHLKSVLLYPKNKFSVYTTTADSTLTGCEKRVGIIKNPATEKNSLICFEGEITDDSFGSSGFYELDNQATLCLSYLKLATNIPRVKKGDKVLLQHCHFIHMQQTNLVFLCFRGNLSIKKNSSRVDPLFPKQLKEDNLDFLQDLALNNNSNINVLFPLHQLCKSICQNFGDVLINVKNITRKKVNGNQKGVMALLVDHFNTISPIALQSRTPSREFLDHKSGCAPYNNKELGWRIDLWPLDIKEIQELCKQRSLWQRNNNDQQPEGSVGTNEKDSQFPPHYWEHEVAVIESCPERICLLMGILSFVNGVWELRDKKGSIECAAPERDCHQYRDRCVFATKWVVHRETFSTDDQELVDKVYISIDSFHAASLPTNDDSVSMTPFRDNPSQRNSVRFLVLDKSMPQLIYFSLPATRHVFGYLVVASLYSHSVDNDVATADQPLTKRRKHEAFSSSAPATQDEDGGPTQCILCFDQNHKSFSYPEVMEGRVYQMELDRKLLLKIPLYLASLKDLPLKSALKNVYLIPENVGVHLVNYNLPKSAQFLSRDVLSAIECLNQEVGDTVSLRGRIVDRMHLDPRFASEKVGQAFKTHRGTWLGIPGNKKLVLKIGEEREDSYGSRVDVYFNLREGQVYPLGLYMGCEVEITWLYVHKTQKTGRLYCTSTVLTAIRLLKMGRRFGPMKPRLEMVKESCSGIRYFAQLKSLRHKEVFSCLASVRYIHKLSIKCVCVGCKYEIRRNSCTYSGCYSKAGYRLDLNAWCTVEDGTGKALMFFNGESCRRWLKFPSSVWQVLEQQVLPHEGEYVFPVFVKNKTGAYLELSVASKILSLYLEQSSHLRRPLYMIADKLVNNKDAEDGGGRAYYFKENPENRLFCVHVDEMDPTRCAIELSALTGATTTTTTTTTTDVERVANGDKRRKSGSNKQQQPSVA